MDIIVRKNIADSFIKGTPGVDVYADTPLNRKLNRVGKPYEYLANVKDKPTLNQQQPTQQQQNQQQPTQQNKQLS